MFALLAAGHTLAPLAFDLLITTSIGAAAGLASLRIIGPRKPGLGFVIVAAALIIGSASAFVHVPLLAELGLPGALPRTLEASGEGQGPALAESGQMNTAGTEGGGPAASMDSSRAAPILPGSFDWIGGIGLAWLVGAGGALAYRIAGLLAAASLLAGARPCRDARILAAADQAARELEASRKTELLLSPSARTLQCRLPGLEDCASCPGPGPAGRQDQAGNTQWALR